VAVFFSVAAPERRCSRCRRRQRAGRHERQRYRL